ncbi:1818_t:CDS:1, partial [Racocetra fulgida]
SSDNPRLEITPERFKKSHSRFNQTGESLLDDQEPDLEGK